MVMTIQQAFEQARKDVDALSRSPSAEDMLMLYALYKQGSQGDVTGSRPGMFDMLKRAKFDAWAKCKGMPREKAMQKYVDKANELQKTNK